MLLELIVVGSAFRFPKHEPDVILKSILSLRSARQVHHVRVWHAQNAFFTPSYAYERPQTCSHGR